ncbi:MAG: peptide MFS transporter [Acidobacteriota bacterium]|nr:peptide MFS transporter [Acidobacteriota bacterium]
MATAAAVDQDRRFFGHPRGLSTLFFTELWERFSFYGMRGLLILSMTRTAETGGLGFTVAKAGAIYGLYTAMVYLMGVPGGWIADRMLGQRRAVLYGGVIIALGHYSLALPGANTFYLGLVLVVIGTGLLKPNVSTMVGQLYQVNDPRRDAGFSIYYMGINIGSFVAPLLCSYLGENINWHYGFGLAGAGMTFGVIQYTLGAKNLSEKSLPPRQEPREEWRMKLMLAIAAIVAVLAAVLLFSGALSGIMSITAQQISDAFGIVLIAVVAGVFGWLLFGAKWTAVERRRLIAIFVLFIAATLFWSLYEQAGSTLNLFADRSTDRTLGGMFPDKFPAGWFQSLNPLFVITLAPVFAWLWVRLGSRNPSSPAKFAVGLLFVGAGFLVLLPVASGHAVSPFWLTLTYLLHTIGELCLSPVGLSAMTKLAPVRVASLTMGVWFLADAVGNYIGGRLASVYEAFPLTALFGLVGASTIVLGVVLALLAPSIKRLMGGVN